MPTDPYVVRMVAANPYRAKSEVTGRVCAVLDLHYERRGLELIPQPSRAVRRGEVHELFLTDEAGAGPGQAVHRVAVLGFFEVERGGVILRGDRVTIGGRFVGTVAGFDETHAPNHLNVVLRGPQARSGTDLGLALGEPVAFTMQPQTPDGRE